MFNEWHSFRIVDIFCKVGSSSQKHFFKKIGGTMRRRYFTFFCLYFLLYNCNTSLDKAKSGHIVDKLQKVVFFPGFFNEVKDKGICKVEKCVAPNKKLSLASDCMLFICICKT